MIKEKRILLKIFLIVLLMLVAVSTETLATSSTTVTELRYRMIGEKAYLQWNTVSDASGYEVYASLNNGKYCYLGDSLTNSVYLTGIQPNVVYNIKVRAYQLTANGSRRYSVNYSNIITINISNSNDSTVLDAIKDLKVTKLGESSTLSWSKISGAAGYDIYVYIPNMGYKCIGSVTNNAVTIQGFETGKTYYAKVIAYRYINGIKETAKQYSNEVSIRIENTLNKPSEDVTSEKLSRVTGLTAKVTGTSVQLSWNKVDNATGYEITVTTPNGNEISTTTTETTKKILNITNTKSNYSAKVVAYTITNGKKVYGTESVIVYFKGENQTTENPSDKPVQSTEKLTKVSGLKAQVSGQAVTFTWDSVAGADGYEIYMDVPYYSGMVWTVEKNKARITGLTEYGVSYTTKVRAYSYDKNGKKIYGDYSNEVEVYRD